MKILFFIFSNANIQFVKKEIIWKRYIAIKALFITKKIKLINKKKFAVIALDADNKIFIMHIAVLNIKSIIIAVYLSQIAQIRLLKANKVLTIVCTKYSNYTNVFLPKLAAKLLKYTNINNYAIKLEKSRQPPYGLIYSLGQGR